MPATLAGLLQVAILLAMLAAVYKPVGDYLARVFTDRKHLAGELVIYRTARVDPAAVGDRHVRTCYEL